MAANFIIMFYAQYSDERDRLFFRSATQHLIHVSRGSMALTSKAIVVAFRSDVQRDFFGRFSRKECAGADEGRFSSAERPSTDSSSADVYPANKKKKKKKKAREGGLPGFRS